MQHDISHLMRTTRCFSIDRLRAFAPLRAILFGLLLLAVAESARAENWDRFRGPNGSGQSDDNSIPSKWKAENYLWKQPLTGIGHSSPVIWGDILFLTSADTATGAQLVSAFDVKTGTPLWQKQFPGSSYHINDLNSRASSTPAVDASRVYVLWLDNGKVHSAALTHEGDEVWQRELGSFQETHGFGVSPIVVGDLAYVATDSETESALMALDSKTGNVRWTLPREAGTTAFATPCVLETSGSSRQKLLLTSSTAAGLSAVDAMTGKVAWHGFTDDLSQRCVASPIVAGGLIFVGCGQGGNGKLILAVRPGDDHSPPREAYRLKQNMPQVPTPVVAGDLLFVWSDKGIVSCYDLSTGKQHWRERIGGDYHASPLRIGDRIFGFSRNGEVVVLAADRDFKEIARNTVPEPLVATPAVANHRLFLRTDSTLYCIGEPGKN
jgi:outer membrane protein assembly factor BamB